MVVIVIVVVIIVVIVMSVTDTAPMPVSTALKTIEHIVEKAHDSSLWPRRNNGIPRQRWRGSHKRPELAEEKRRTIGHRTDACACPAGSHHG
jgi:hypothetical protein